jgi:hypothetical protein
LRLLLIEVVSVFLTTETASGFLWLLLKLSSDFFLFLIFLSAIAVIPGNFYWFFCYYQKWGAGFLLFLIAGYFFIVVWV